MIALNYGHSGWVVVEPMCLPKASGVIVPHVSIAWPAASVELCDGEEETDIEWGEASEVPATRFLGFNKSDNIWENFCFFFGGGENVVAKDRESRCGTMPR